ncbi:hypothetical protein [Nostoc sp. MG11]|uniref:hypothetical protein n=1 Tax=Nostoc sp. MG11 TaxID=2721166 RepID=UPI00186933C9|nr:hypothetical protein [Nostoc sp. MG11]
MTMVEISSESLTDAQWKIAHAIAQILVKENTDVNELEKAVAYLRASIHQPDATSKFFKYLKALVNSGRQIGHSGRTTDYYRSIDKACSDYLKGIQDAYTILQILGWVSRLMRYYKDAGPIGEIQFPSVKSVRQVEITKAITTHNFVIGQILEAKITAIKGNKVTYEILKTLQKLTEREPKKAQFFIKGQIVKVEIIDLKEDKTLKKVKSTD